jgi:pimeloyl-ACP methyl ester carboxylesterase
MQQRGYCSLTGRMIGDVVPAWLSTTMVATSKMIETRSVQTAPGLIFDVSVGGAGDAPLVLMLHGFGVSRYFWNAQVNAVAAAGFLAVAPNQRGYAAGARPDPADHASYRVELLIGDALAIAAAFGHQEQKFHLVGHDWGASLAWQIADQSPERLASLTSLSRPHPLAFNRALNLPDGEQKRRSQHHTRFLGPDAGPDILADDAKWLRTRLTANGVPQAAIEAHLSVIGNPPAMEAALAWYRARGVRHQPTGPTTVPTLYIWGDADDTVGRTAAEGTGEFIAAPYRFAALHGVGHYAADQVPEQVNALLLEHLARHPG